MRAAHDGLVFMRGMPPPRPTPAGAEMVDAKRTGVFAVCPSRLVPGPAAVDAAPAEMLWWVQLNPEWERRNSITPGSTLMCGKLSSSVCALASK